MKGDRGWGWGGGAGGTTEMRVGLKRFSPPGTKLGFACSAGQHLKVGSYPKYDNSVQFFFLSFSM